MRVLFTVMPSIPHLYPYIPLAWALQGAGHEVCFASYPGLAGPITNAGLNAVLVGEEKDLGTAVQECAVDPRIDAIVGPLAGDPQERDLWQLIRLYLMSPFWMAYADDRPGQRQVTDDLVAFAETWRPDLVLWDPMFFPAPLAARASGAAHARVLWGPDYFAWTRSRFLTEYGRPGSGVTTDRMAELMCPELERLGQSFDEELLVGQSSIDTMPAELRLPVDHQYLPVRWVPYTGTDIFPGWLHGVPDKPRACLTLGTSRRQFFDRNRTLPMLDLLEMVADLDVELVATLNADQLASVDRVPPNVRLVDYVPLNQLLPTCSAIIHHGGGGTFAAALAHGVPQLVVARRAGISADYAQFVTRHGAGLVGPDIDSAFDADEVKSGLVRILGDPSFQAGAAALRADLESLPSPNQLVPALEEIASARCPQGRPATTVR